MVEGKLRKASQIADNLISLGIFPSFIAGAWDFDMMNYKTTPTFKYTVSGTFAADTFLGSGSEAASGAMAGNRAGFSQPSALIPFSPDGSFTFEAYVTTQDTVEQEVFVGLASDVPSAADPPVPGADGIYFHRVDGAAVGNWIATVRNSTVDTDVATGVVGAAVDFKLKIVSDGINIKFYIDGVLKATIANPALGVTLGVIFNAITTENVAKTLSVHGWKCNALFA